MNSEEVLRLHRFYAILKSNKGKDFKEEYDSYKDVVEFQNHSLNPGHYVGTGRVPPTVSAPGNAMPLVVACFLASGFFLFLGLRLFFSDITITSSDLIESERINRIIFLVIFVGIALLFAFFGFVYLKKAKSFYCAKSVQKEETADDDEWQLTCPKCGTTHDVEEAKCPNCHFDYNP